MSTSSREVLLSTVASGETGGLQKGTNNVTCQYTQHKYTCTWRSVYAYFLLVRVTYVSSVSVFHLLEAALWACTTKPVVRRGNFALSLARVWTHTEKRKGQLTYTIPSALLTQELADPRASAAARCYWHFLPSSSSCCTGIVWSTSHESGGCFQVRGWCLSVSVLSLSPL